MSFEGKEGLNSQRGRQANTVVQNSRPGGAVTGFGIVAVMYLICSQSAFATEYVGEAKVAYVGGQATRPIQPSTDHWDYMNFLSSITWTINGGSGGSMCSTVGAALPQGNSMMRAVALAAISSGATVIVTVDNTLPLVGSLCQATTLIIKSG